MPYRHRDDLVETEDRLGPVWTMVDQRIVQAAEARAGVEGRVLDPRLAEHVDHRIRHPACARLSHGQNCILYS